jgi:hypothetical protein
VASSSVFPAGFFMFHFLKVLTTKSSLSSQLIPSLIVASFSQVFTKLVGLTFQFQKNFCPCMAVKIASTNDDFQFQLYHQIIFQSNNSVEIQSIFLKFCIST